MWLPKVSVNLTAIFNISTKNYLQKSTFIDWLLLTDYFYSWFCSSLADKPSEMFFKKSCHRESNFYAKVLFIRVVKQINKDSRSQMFYKKGVLNNFARTTIKYLCWNLFFIRAAGWSPVTCNFLKRGTLPHAFSCEFCKIFKNIFSWIRLAITSFLWRIFLL